MKRNSFISLIAVFITLCAGVVVSSCDDSKDDALSEGLSIKVYSPTKVIEGQEVVINGTGLDGVTSVVFPGGVSVTAIKAVTSNDIRVIAPAGIAAQGGELTVQAGNQSVTARIPLTVGSPSVATLAPGDKAGIGDELIITGTDMEFFEKAIFPGDKGDVVVNAIDFNRKSTGFIKLNVPEGTKNGTAQIRLVSCANKEVLLPALNFIVAVVEEKDPITVSAFPADLELAKGQKVIMEGITGISGWWIDPDFFGKVDGSDNEFIFQAATGTYRITANTTLTYFAVEVLLNGELATTQADGTGAIWIIGDGNIGKPSYASNGISWTPSKGFCMAPIGNKKYRVTLVAGTHIKTDAINFKFFFQKNWGGEFTHDKISTTSDLILMGDGTNGADSGNLNLKSGVKLENGAAYEFIVDLSGGTNSAKLTISQK